MKTLTLLLSLCVITQGFSQNTNSEQIVRETTSLSGSSEVVTINGYTFIVQQSIGQTSPIGTVDPDNKTVLQGFIQPNVLAKILTPDIPEDLQMNVYPNPFTEETTIDFGSTVKQASIRLVDVYGKIIKDYTVENTDKYIIKRNNKAKGIYFLEVQVGDSYITNIKVVID